MTALGRWLRLDESSWARFARLGTLSNAAFITLGSYALLAFDRFGMQGLTAPRAPVRMVLAGLYGWLGLSVAIWLHCARGAWLRAFAVDGYSSGRQSPHPSPIRRFHHRGSLRLLASLLACPLTDLVQRCHLDAGDDGGGDTNGTSHRHTQGCADGHRSVRSVACHCRPLSRTAGRALVVTTFRVPPDVPVTEH